MTVVFEFHIGLGKRHHGVRVRVGTGLVAIAIERIVHGEGRRLFLEVKLEREEKKKTKEVEIPLYTTRVVQRED